MAGDDDVTVIYRGPANRGGEAVRQRWVHPSERKAAARWMAAPLGSVQPRVSFDLGEVRGAAGRGWVHPGAVAAPQYAPEHAAAPQQPAAAPVQPTKAGLFRREAVDAYQRGSTHGSPLRVVPTWMVWSVRIVVLVVLAAVAFAAVAPVTEYASGTAVVRVEGRRVIGATTTGTVSEILVHPGQRVQRGDVLLRFDDSLEKAELRRIDREHELLLARLLRDPNDEALRQQIAALDAQRVVASARLDERTVRAPLDGLASDVRVHVGQHAQPGDALLAIDDESARVVVIAMMPGHHRPRLREDDPEMTLELAGFERERIPVRLRSIADEVVGPNEALRFLGDEQAGASPPPGPVVIVEATLDRRTFEADGDQYRLYDGMQGVLEAELDRDTLLQTVLPWLDGLMEAP